MEPLTPPPPYTEDANAPMPRHSISPSQKLEMVQAELEIAKLRLRQQARERHGQRRDISSRMAVFERMTTQHVTPALRGSLELTGPGPDQSNRMDHRRIAWNMILSEEHAPSHLSMTTLTKIPLRALSMETHHHGNMLLLRATSVSAMHSTMQTCVAVEDEYGDHELLTIYDFAVINHPSKAIQNGTFFVVKEPFFRTVLDEACVLCIDHPSDILFLEPDDPLIPLAWRVDNIPKSPLQWKQAGNVALRSQNPWEAERCYNRSFAAMTASQENDIMGSMVYRNRAQARLCLEHWDGAYDDALAGMQVLPDIHDDFLEFQNMKALYRAGRAAYELGTFDRALSAYNAVLEISPRNTDGLRELRRTENRIMEQSTGINLWKATGPQAHGTNVDHADFLRRTELLSLYAGPNYPPLKDLEIPMVDGRPVIDIFRIENIIEYNSFGYGHDPELTSFGNTSLATPGMDNMDGSMGLWLHASAINHSCLFNAEHSFIGDMIIFRATRDIAKDEEITTLYKEINADYDTRDTAFRTWNFSCDCKMCKADRACPATGRRKYILQQAKDFLAKLPLLNATVEPRKIILMFEDLIGQLEKTYPDELYNDLPRLGLITLNRYCAYAYCLSDPNKALEHSFAVIAAHGYKMKINGDDVEFDRTDAMSAPQVVDQLMNISKHKLNKGQHVLASHLRDLALEMYIIINGEPSGFETRYGRGREL
ncbi:hypothetical protein E4T43_08119 [Aureobasidium subglaciale]|nr:hypothetical protein E4T43_08119 [Aureobasidium subglaciale]